jgi:hypothetical protein
MRDIFTASPPLMNVLLPVALGGFLAIIGGLVSGLVGPYIIQRVRDAAEKKRKRAEKYEELVAAVYEHAHWIDAMRFFVISGQGSAAPTLSPITKILAIVNTYFPEFEELVLQFVIASSKYEQWIWAIGQKRVKNEPGYENLIGFDDVLTEYMDQQKAFLIEFRRFAQREFQ